MTWSEMAWMICRNEIGPCNFLHVFTLKTKLLSRMSFILFSTLFEMFSTTRIAAPSFVSRWIPTLEVKWVRVPKKIVQNSNLSTYVTTRLFVQQKILKCTVKIPFASDSQWCLPLSEIPPQLFRRSRGSAHVESHPRPLKERPRKDLLHAVARVSAEPCTYENI